MRRRVHLCIYFHLQQTVHIFIAFVSERVRWHFAWGAEVAEILAQAHGWQRWIPNMSMIQFVVGRWALIIKWTAVIPRWNFLRRHGTTNNNNATALRDAYKFLLLVQSRYFFTAQSERRANSCAFCLSTFHQRAAVGARRKLTRAQDTKLEQSNGHQIFPHFTLLSWALDSLSFIKQQPHWAFPLARQVVISTAKINI